MLGIRILKKGVGNIYRCGLSFSMCTYLSLITNCNQVIHALNIMPRHIFVTLFNSITIPFKNKKTKCIEKNLSFLDVFVGCCLFFVDGLNTSF